MEPEQNFITLKPFILLYPDNDDLLDFRIAVQLPKEASNLVALPKTELFEKGEYKYFGWKGIYSESSGIRTEGSDDDVPYFFYECSYPHNNNSSLFKFNKEKPTFAFNSKDKNTCLESIVKVLLGLGLNKQEAFNMSTFWFSQFKGDHVQAQFLIGSECDAISKLIVVPGPHSTLRIYAIFICNSDSKFEDDVTNEKNNNANLIKMQKKSVVIDRSRYCVVEYGGCCLTESQ